MYCNSPEKAVFNLHLIFTCRLHNRCRTCSLFYVFECFYWSIKHVFSCFYFKIYMFLQLWAEPYANHVHLAADSDVISDWWLLTQPSCYGPGGFSVAQRTVSNHSTELKSTDSNRERNPLASCFDYTNWLPKGDALFSMYTQVYIVMWWQLTHSD